MPKNENMTFDKAQIEEFLTKNMPSIKELAPVEYEKLLELQEIIGNKYNEKARALLIEKGIMEEDIKAGCAFMAGAAVALAGIVGKEVHDKATGK